MKERVRRGGGQDEDFLLSFFAVAYILNTDLNWIRDSVGSFFVCFIQPKGADNCPVRYCLPTARLKTSYDWIQLEWQNTQVKQVHLYQTLQVNQAQLFSKLNKRSELTSISTSSGRHRKSYLLIFGWKKKPKKEIFTW